MKTTPTLGVRTWRRTQADPSAPVSERVVETTRPADMAAALATADFVTIPREGPTSSGYPDGYAEAFNAALAEAYGYSGGRRVSASGRSHVFEREASPQGAAVDLGVPSRRAPATSHGSQASPSGDGSALGRPALARR